MNTSVNIVKDYLICIEYNHNEQVMLCIADDQDPLKDRFLCSKCLKTHQSVAKMMPIDSAIASIQEKIKAKITNKKSKDRHRCKYLNNFTKIMKMFNEIQRIAQEWILDLDNLQQQDDSINIIEELKKKIIV